MDYNIKEVLTEEQSNKLTESVVEGVTESVVEGVTESMDDNYEDKIKICGKMMENRWIEKMAKTIIITSTLSSVILTSCLILYKRKKYKK